MENQNEKLEKDFHFENENDQLLGVETAVYKNGNTVKRVKLSNGKTAIVRELNGADMMKVDKMVAGRADDYIPALLHHSVKVNDEQVPMEDFCFMKGKDYNKVKALASQLNF